MGDGSTPQAAAALVSVVMPAYKATWLPQALESVRRQTHRPLELVICDDSRDGRIQAIVEAFAADAGFPVHYSRNPSRLWETRSTARAISMASGEFIKFLHDDDVLHDDCIAALLEAFRRAPDAALAMSRRRLVDASGDPLPDTPSTAFPPRDVLIDGDGLVDFLADHTINFLGEPSAAMCRRLPLLAMGDGLSMLDGTRITWVADLALYAKLLRHGPVAMLAAPRVDFRVSREQYSQIGRDRPGIGNPAHAAFRNAIRNLGWYRGDGDVREVALAPLDRSRPAEPVDLVQALEQAHAERMAHWHKHDWHARRRLTDGQAGRLDARLAVSGTRLGIVVAPGPDGCKAARRTLASLPRDGIAASHIAVKAALDRDDRKADGDAVAPLPWDAADPADSLNAAIADWNVDWLLVVEAGTEFTAGGMACLLAELAGADALQAVYADEWYRDAEGAIAPALRPDLNLDLLLGNPCAMAGHWILRRAAVLEAGGFDPEHAGAEELDLVLRLLLQHGLGTVGHLPEPLLYRAPPRLAEAAQQRAIQRHLQARGYADARVHGAGPGLHRIDYGHGRQPRVSLVVVAPQALAPLERCVVSLLEQTAWPDYELLLVDNGSPAPVREWMLQVAALMPQRVRVIATGASLPPPAARNLAAMQASGEFLLFLEPDIAALQAQWLHALLNHGLRPEVGIVGAKTVSADGTVTHAGLVPGLMEGGGRVFAGKPMDAGGYMGRLQVAHDVSAVSGSCLLVARELFDALGGFDAVAFPGDGDGADVDLCLRAGVEGRLTVWTPDALLLHAVEARPLAAGARDALCERWLPALARDPAYNPNLRLDVSGGFELDQTELSWRPLPAQAPPRVLAQPSDGHGSGHYRILQPFQALHAAGTIEGAASPRALDIVEVERFTPEVIVMQRRVGDADLERMARLRRFSPAFKVYELDDWLPDLPARNIHRRHMPRDVARRLRDGLKHMDRFVVSTPALAEACAGWHADIRVAGNRLDPGLWNGLPVPARRAGRPRVGWAGGVSHDGDLHMIAEVVRTLAGEVDWVFFGMCPERLRPHVAEFHAGVPLGQYPRVLAALGLDLALAPLEDHRFNTCKSNLRLLEYGACGYPVVCSDLEPYRGDLPATRVRNRTRDWVEAIRMHLADRNASAAAGQALRAAVRRDWMLEGTGLEDWRRAWLPD